MQLLAFCVRGRSWVAGESDDMWSLHTIHYYYNHCYLPIHWHSAAIRNLNPSFLGGGLSSSFLINYLLVSTVLCMFRLSDNWMMPIGMRRHGIQLCLLPGRELRIVSTFLLPAQQWYKFIFDMIDTSLKQTQIQSPVLNNDTISPSKRLLKWIWRIISCLT